MKRLSALPLLCLLVLSLLPAGCTSYNERTTTGANLAAKKHFFVLSNLNDNHAIDRLVEAELKSRGYDGSSGPHTMMPDDAEVLVTYDENWAWDFGDHLVYLQLTATNTRTGELYATASFKAKIPSNKSVEKIIAELIDRMLVDAKAKKKH